MALVIGPVVAAVLGFGGSAALVMTPGIAEAHHTNFQGTCSGSASTISTWKRSQAKSYAQVVDKEGYQWGGGCWNNNNIDDSPGDPPENSSTKGEGPDCSGLVFKTWGLKNDASSNGFRSYPRMMNIHGNFTANIYKTGNNSLWGPVTKANAIAMDAFASSGHIGMIYTTTTTAGSDTIVEAKSESAGSGIWTRTYRGDSAYSGVRRKGWTAECYPTCQ